MSVNGGNVKNTGIEVGLHWNDNIGKDFQYGANLTLAHNKNEVTKIANKDGIIHGSGSVLWEGAEECFRAEVGKPIGYFYGYKSNGIFQNQEQIDNYKGPKLNGDKTQPGDVIWADTDNSGTLDANDRTMIGKPNPDWTYGFTLSADWKGLDFRGSIGNDIYKLYRRSNVTFGNYDKSWLNRWHGEGTSNWVPRIIDGDNNNYQVSNFFVEDGSYMRLKVLQIGYSLPGQMLQRVGVKGLRFFVQGENLFTITNYSGYDPEVGTRDGFDGGTYPQARTYTIGANITF